MTRKDELLPSALEAILYAVVTGLIVLLGNFRFLTDYLTSDTAEARESFVRQANTFGNDFLKFLDGLSFTSTTAVFLFWCLAGIIIFSILQAAYNVYAEVKQDVDISTHFLHPRNFIKRDFWIEVILQSVAHLSLFIMLLMSSLIVASVFSPLAINRARILFDGFDLAALVGFALSFLVLYIGVVILAVILKLFLRRKQLVI